MLPLHLLLPIVLITSVGQSSGGRIDGPLEAIISKFEKAFQTRSLNSFSNPGSTGFQVTVIHSLIEPPKGKSSRRFTSFGAFEKWLRSKEHGGKEPGEDLLPSREARSRSLVRPGVIEYENQGISHNTLYLSRIRFTQKGQTYSITEVVLYDGD